MRHLHSFVFAALALVTPAVAVLAADTAAIAPSDVTEVRALDEVVVTGNLKSLSEAKKAVIEAEERFYARYNELNKDHRFDIVCHMDVPADHPSRITTRVCEPRYISDGTNAEGVKLQSIPTEGNIRLASTESIRMAGMGEMRKRTLELIRKDPELLRALLERARLQEHFDELRKEKFKDRWISWD